MLQDATCESGPKRSGGDRRASPASGPRSAAGRVRRRRADRRPKESSTTPEASAGSARGCHRTGPSSAPHAEPSCRRARRTADREERSMAIVGGSAAKTVAPAHKRKPPGIRSTEGFRGAGQSPQLYDRSSREHVLTRGAEDRVNLVGPVRATARLDLDNPPQRDDLGSGLDGRRNGNIDPGKL